MEYKTGQIFDTYPPIDVINWCNETQHTVDKCDKGYQIVVPNGFIEVDGQCRSMTQKELLKNNLLSAEKYANDIKQQRDYKLAEMDKYSIMHIEGALTDEQYEKVKKHKDYLREIPQSKGFPETFTDFEDFVL